LELASSVVLDGAGLIGDSIGITDTQFLTTTGTTPGAPRFTTGTISTEEAAARAVGLQAAPAPGIGLPPGTSAVAAEFTTVPAERPGPSGETTRLLEDTRNLAVRAEPVREPSAATTVADRQEAIRPAEAGVSAAGQRAAEGVERLTVVVAERLTAAVAGIGNRSLMRVRVLLGDCFYLFLVDGFLAVVEI